MIGYEATPRITSHHSWQSALPKVGIGITTHNRYDTFLKSYQQIKRMSPLLFKIIVVDDASSQRVPEANYRFDKNVGIAVAKNKCFELLDDCDHIFLFDDDTYPVDPSWWVPYVESGQPHLMYIFPDFATGKKLNDTALIYEDSKLRAWSHARGVMCYFRKECLDKVGGMDPVFGRWGWEHPDLSNRIFNAGLTKFKYADVAGSEKLFYSADEHQAVKSTVTGADRTAQIKRNEAIYEQRKSSAQYVPYKDKRNVVLTSYFTTLADPQRGVTWEFDSSQIVPLAISCAGEASLVILYDALPGTANKAGGAIGDDNSPIHHLLWRRVKTSINPYFQRWLSYYEYLVDHREEIDKVFCVDATDVEMLKNPFPHMQPGILYTGDEPGQIACEWMLRHHRAPVLIDFFKQYATRQIANAGLLGGDVETVIKFCKAMVDFYCECASDAFHKKQEGPGDTDMGAFNYIVYTKFGSISRHGRQVNTRFKANERNDISWWKHK
ncbi:glycosyltransferase family 2 protein [Chitinophaga pinensis]|uniref:Glycosyltransferase n=1 Tax=Chitinophaga pinensis (strain ATCC 43595 / DSM 2588 / LMG 13176 / NBRC 15968 / NCIMB 11800 / UQM 2034) TaxID=485918 RepID=A0A979G619_CHIPD|nr:galactosyltransferase-related protein [Chitinophaga pinensis]ACU61343.1 conserved hypothetical protein [Chitinophaga pinensis DSM 2588]